MYNKNVLNTGQIHLFNSYVTIICVAKDLLNQDFIVAINSCNLVTFLWSLRTNWYMVNTIWETLTIYLSLYILSSDSHESISFYLQNYKKHWLNKVSIGYRVHNRGCFTFFNVHGNITNYRGYRRVLLWNFENLLDLNHVRCIYEKSFNIYIKPALFTITTLYKAL